MISEKSDRANYRYERKFFVSQLTKEEIESIVQLHPAMFSEIYHRRYINNIYLDTNDFSNYVDSIDGLACRVKVRIRWYKELFGTVEKPVLEMKIKKGLLGRKVSYPIRPFLFDDNFSSECILKTFRESEIPDLIKTKIFFLKPVLLNRYNRRYFQSADGNYRITIDDSLVFYRYNNLKNSFLNKVADRNNTILEIKYDNGNESEAKKITNFFPFRINRISKYLDGIEKLYVL